MGCVFMSNEFSPDLMTLIDDEGQEHLFEILDVIENEKGCFYALLPKSNVEEDNILESANYYIFEVIDGDDEPLLAEVEDSKLLESLERMFEAHFEELYDENEMDNNF
ncbi:MAG: hypothetical protein RUMPE_00733 [Eubacteriales bacterium SKADARSKE-1]|nr:hypothetical protein [Eubacteriales bacterium SKADARSKE-1]